MKISTPSTARTIFPGLRSPNVFVCHECAKKVRKYARRGDDTRYSLTDSCRKRVADIAFTPLRPLPTCKKVDAKGTPKLDTRKPRASKKLFVGESSEEQEEKVKTTDNWKVFIS